MRQTSCCLKQRICTATYKLVIQTNTNLIHDASKYAVYVVRLRLILREGLHVYIPCITAAAARCVYKALMIQYSGA